MSSSNFQDVEKTPLIASTPPEYFDEHDFLVLCKKQKRRRRLRIFSRILLLFVSSFLLWNYFSNEETFGCNSVASSTNRSDFKSFTLSPEKSKLFLKVEDRLSSPIEHLVDPSSDLKEVTVEISGYQSFRNVKVEKVVKDDEEGIVVENTNHWRMSNYWNGDKKNYGIRVIFPKDVKIKSFETFTDGNQVSADDLTGLQLDEWKVKSRDGSVRLGSIETKSLIEIESHFGSIQSSGLLKSNSIKLDSQNGAISLSQVKASKELRLHSSFASISGEFSSPILDFEGHSGSIRGTFNVSKELKLDSNMGSINGKINLVQDDDSNGEISITSSSEQGSNVLTFLNEVEDLKLNLNATSSMGKVDVTFVEDGFQGDFKIDSGLGSVHVEGPQDEKYDWEIVKENHGPVKSEVEGWVAKKGNGGKKGWGKLDLKTHLGSAHLKL